MSSRKGRKRGRPRSSSKLPAEEQLRLLTASAELSDAELGIFLRKEGLHEVDLAQMRAAALAGLEPPKRNHGATSEERTIRSLERELRRKEKALAETAALLVLSKKYRAIMADVVDDTSDDNDENS